MVASWAGSPEDTPLGYDLGHATSRRSLGTPLTDLNTCSIVGRDTRARGFGIAARPPARTVRKRVARLEAEHGRDDLRHFNNVKR